MNNMKTFRIKTNIEELIFYESIEDDCKAIIFTVHGMAEHARRYTRFSSVLNNNGFGFASLDLSGHGLSVAKGREPGEWPENGFDYSINVIKDRINYISEKYGKPVILFGHSMGAFLSLGIISKYKGLVIGCILSGSNDAQPAILLLAGKIVTAFIIKTKGWNYRSKLLDAMSFGKFNNKFKPARTKFDWLSRDMIEVDKYVADSLCGYICSAGLFKGFLKGLGEIYDKKRIRKIERDLPVYIFSGENDPVGDFGKGPENLKIRLNSNGVSNVKLKLYHNARHECLNETNHDEVLEDIISFIKDVLKTYQS